MSHPPVRAQPLGTGASASASALVKRTFTDADESAAALFEGSESLDTGLEPLQKRGRLELDLEILMQRMDAIESKQSEILASVDDLNASVSKLKRSANARRRVEATSAQERDRMKASLVDACEHLGASVVDMHKDFGVLVRHVGTTFEKLGKVLDEKDLKK